MPRQKTGRMSSSDAVEQQLARYRKMRDVSMTAEPSGTTQKRGKSEPAEGLPFVIQKHAATRLHYDFRLGWHGVLKSWAVAKGPSYYTGDKRLAVEVEDHPMEYGGFEGTIPKGQYGGGTVMVWDQGTWEPQDDAEEGFRTGRLKFVLHGEKLKGKWTLVRMGGRAARESKPNWLLIKEHDEYERSPDDTPITESEPNSVVTGRDLEAIAEAEDHVWNSRESGRTQNRSRLTRRRGPVAEPEKVEEPPDREEVLKDAPREKLGKFVPPQLATQVTAPPAGDNWLHELKFDGYRILAVFHNGKLELVTRRGNDWTARFRPVADAVKELPLKNAVLDGEVVSLDERCQESLGQVTRIFRVETAAAEVGVERIPVGLAERREGLTCRLRVVPSGRQHEAAPRRFEGQDDA